MKIKYENYTTEDFLKDEFFIKWVKNPSPETDHFWEAWVAEHPEMHQKISKSKEIISSIGYKNVVKPTQKKYNDILENVLRAENQSDTEYTEIQRHKYSFLKYAASILIVLATGTYFYFQQFSEKSELENEQSLVANFIEKNTPTGQKSTYLLSDGTKVKLNSQSKISFPEKFTGNKRTIYLEGEAFFEVTKDSTRPFEIISKGLKTTVLGTSFNIRAYPEEDKVQVAVSTGKVKVNNNVHQGDLESNFTYLLPDEMAEYSHKEKLIEKRKFDRIKVFAWKDGIIHFDKVTFEEVHRKLERWYGVKFVITNNKQVQGRFSGTFENQTLRSVLDGLMFSSNSEFSFDINGKVVTIL